MKNNLNENKLKFKIYMTVGMMMLLAILFVGYIITL